MDEITAAIITAIVTIALALGGSQWRVVNLFNKLRNEFDKKIENNSISIDKKIKAMETKIARYDEVLSCIPIIRNDITTMTTKFIDVLTEFQKQNDKFYKKFDENSKIIYRQNAEIMVHSEQIKDIKEDIKAIH